MNLLFWKKTSKLVEPFAAELATSFFSAVPPEMLDAYLADKAKDKKTTKKVERQVEEMIARIKQFKASHKLGVYGKAKLHQKLMDRLIELGYESETVTGLNKTLMLRTP